MKKINAMDLNDNERDLMCKLCNQYQDTNRSTCEGSRCEIAFEYFLEDKEQKEADLQEHTHNVNMMLLVGSAKLFSEQSTFMINEMKDSKSKHHFNQAVKYIDKFIKIAEKGVKTEHEQTTMEILITEMNAGIQKLRNELIKAE